MISLCHSVFPVVKMSFELREEESAVLNASVYLCCVTGFRIFEVGAAFPSALIFANSSGTVVFTPSNSR